MAQIARENVLDSLDPRALAADLKAARIRSGMTQEQAGALIGVGRTTVVALEQGMRRVTPQELIALAHGYGRQVSDFVRQRPRVESFDPQFRGPVKPSDADQARIAQQVALFKDLCQLYLELEELTASPMVRRYPAEYDTAGLSAEQAAESIALEERNRLRLGSGPVPQVRDVLENDVGLRIFYLDLPNGYSEIYVYTEQLGACLAINRSHPPERRRWSLLHGYAHFLLHRQKAVVEADGAYQRNPVNERIADAFARFFLMPTEGLVRRYNDIRQSKGKVTLVDLCVLAHFYGVSMQALVLRLEELRLISAGKWAELQHDGLKVRDLQARAGVEPLTERDHRYPLRYQLLAVEALDNGVISEGQFAQFLELSRVESRRQAELLRQQDDVASVDSLAYSAGSSASALSEVREERA
jgi:Zn-dependent peptidase ImmA (M78 family)/DNA-binding XRE family transcriptional regulator